MPFRQARDLPLAPPPHCPACGIGIVAYGLREPVAVDGEGHPYCRIHGHTVEPTYPAMLEAYRTARQAERELALRELEAAAVSHPTE